MKEIKEVEIMLLDTVKTKETTVVCEGNEKTLGHPRVYLDLKKEGFVVCPYCSKKFEHDLVPGSSS